MVKFDVISILCCEPAVYIHDKDHPSYKQFHVRAPSDTATPPTRASTWSRVPRKPICYPPDPSEIRPPNVQQKEKLGTKETEVLSNELLPDGRVKVVTRQVPGIKLPRVVRPVLRGKEVEFRDTRTYVEAEKGKFPFTQTFHTVNNITDRAVVEGTITVSHAADGQTELHVKGECVVKITGLGGKIESVIVENLKRSYQRLPEIIAEWMTVREAMLATPQPKAPPHVRAPTAGSEGDDESHSPTESDAGSTSSFASANSEIGSLSGTSADGSVDGSHSNPFEATRDNTRRDSRDRSKRLPSLEDARSPQPFPIAPDTPPLDKFLDRFRTAAGFETLSGGSGGGRSDIDSADESGGRRDNAREGGSRRGRYSDGSTRRVGALTSLLRACCCYRGEALLSDADSDSERGAGSPASGSDGYVSGGDGAFDAPESILTPLTPGARNTRRTRSRVGR